jgi:hypothetical protein
MFAAIPFDSPGKSLKKSFFRQSRGNRKPAFLKAVQVLDPRLCGNDDFLRVHHRKKRE